MIADTNNVHVYCNLFILFGTCILLTKAHPKFVFAIKAAVIVDENLNCCGYIDNSSHFCNTYYGMIIEK